MANGDIIQKFTKKPKSTKTIDENIEANGNVSVTGDVAVTGTITGNVTGNVTGNADTATHANTADSATTAGSATNDANGDKIDETYLKLTGGTVTGVTKIIGSAGNQRFQTKNVVGLNTEGTAIGELYLQYGAGKQIMLGNTGAYTISSDGSAYSGKASTAGTADTANKIKSNSTNPTSATNYYFTFVSENANSVDLRANTGAYYTTREGTTSQVGQGILRLGNTTASGTAGNKRGYLRICGETAYYSQLQTADGVSANRTIYMPNHNGTIQVRPTNLYNNSTGTAGTVTLSSSAGNFNYLDIYWSNVDDGYIQHSRVATPNNKTFQASSSSYNTSQAKVWFTVKRYKISTTSITVATANYVTAIKGNGISDAPQNYDAIKILRVDGWL